jgi:lysophospholipase L1-like esterase
VGIGQLARRRGVLAAIAAGLAGAAAVAFAVGRADSSGSGRPDLDIAVVGDSFVEQSATQFQAHVGERGQQAEVVAFGGTAVCDRSEILVDLARREPDVLILSFAGNDITPCMQRGDTPTPEGTATEYAEDYERVIAEFLATSPGTRVYMVPPPPIRDAEYEANAAAMRAMYERFAADHPDVTLIDVGAALSPDGGFHQSLPCEDWEAAACQADGTVRLREDDGIHLTPEGGERYARALAEAIDGA